jgi:hypothetical protein
LTTDTVIFTFTFNCQRTLPSRASLE